MPFHIDELTSLSPDVGEPGSSGTIETGTGLLVRIPPWRCDDYGIENPGEEGVFGQNTQSSHCASRSKRISTRNMICSARNTFPAQATQRVISSRDTSY